MAPEACGERPSLGLTGTLAEIINYHPVSPRKGRHRCAAFCLGESPAQAQLKCLDLRCSFEALVKAEYGGREHLDFAAVITRRMSGGKRSELPASRTKEPSGI